MRHFILSFFILFTFSGFSQVSQLNKSSLSIKTIMQDPAKWIGTSPSDISWSEDGAKIYFQWNPELDTLESLYAYDLSTEEIAKVSLDEKKTLPGRRSNYNSDKSKKVYTRNGNLFLLDCKSGKEKQLTAWLERASSPEFVLGDSKIAFVKDNNLVILESTSPIGTTEKVVEILKENNVESIESPYAKYDDFDWENASWSTGDAAFGNTTVYGIDYATYWAANTDLALQQAVFCDQAPLLQASFNSVTELLGIARLEEVIAGAAF